LATASGHLALPSLPTAAVDIAPRRVSQADAAASVYGSVMADSPGGSSFASAFSGSPTEQPLDVLQVSSVRAPVASSSPVTPARSRANTNRWFSGFFSCTGLIFDFLHF
jgi:hypothetical protein